MQLKHYSKMSNQLETCSLVESEEHLLFSDAYLAANNLNFDAPIRNIRSGCFKQGLTFNLLGHLFTFDPTSMIMETMVLDGCKLVFVDILEDLLFPCADCSASGPGPIPSPTPGPAPGSNKWDWATTSSLGRCDQRFTGKPLSYSCSKDPYNANGLNSAVAIPWPILCKQFGSKNCLMKYMAPQCKPTGKSWPNGCAGPDCVSDTSPLPPGGKYPSGSSDRTACNAYILNEKCPQLDENLYKYGICWEAQVVKWSHEEFNRTKHDVNDDDALYGKKNTFTFKLNTGCGGNCGGQGCPLPLSAFPVPGGLNTADCFNGCIGTDPPVQTNPCGIDAPEKCSYLTWTNKNFNINHPISNDTIRNNKSCPPLYLDDGSYNMQFSSKTAIYQPNFCTGNNMHFDIVNNLDGYDFMDGGAGFALSNSKRKILRYRPIQCPKY